MQYTETEQKLRDAYNEDSYEAITAFMAQEKP